VRAVQLFDGGALFDSVNELFCGADADIGGDEQLFKLFPDLFAERGAVEEGHGFAEPGIAGTLEHLFKDINGMAPFKLTVYS
jgi:hypothetical protein